MSETCCTPENINNLENHFTVQRAEEAAEEYLNNGLNSRGEKLVAYLDTETPGFATALDIGCGAGALHHELLQRGLVKKVVGVDASQNYLKKAAENAEKLELSKKVKYIQGDFALNPDLTEAADVVIMDRVVCCYPSLEPLLEPATAKARHYLLLSYPRDTLLERFFFFLSRIRHFVTRSQFHLYYHEPRRIVQLVEEAGFRSVYEDRDGEWQLSVYQRVGA